MRIFLVILLVLGLSACTENKSEEHSNPDENLPEQALPEDENTKEEGDSDENVEDLDEEKSPEEVLDEVKGQIVSEFDVQLPVRIDVSSGDFLSATVDSDAFYYEAAFFETDESTAVNDAQLIANEPFMIVKGTAYDSEEEAQEQIGYQPIQEGMPELNLGHDITGYQDAGAGSAFITWHEGRWSFIMRSQNDEAGNAAGEKLAKEIVEKLEQQTLPPPRENGAGTFSSGKQADVETNRLAWQEKNIVYEVYMADALRLIDVVTEEF